MSIDVLLIKPDFNDIAIMPPLGLGYLAAKLKQMGISVGIHDNTILAYDDNRLETLIKEVCPQVVGISATTPMIKRAMEIAQITKKVEPHILTVLGGPHPTSAVEEVLASRDCDVVVMGEGEETFPLLVKRFLEGSSDFSELLGCAFKNHNKNYIINQPREFIQDLDVLPFPAFEDMDIRSYFNQGASFGILQKSAKSLPIIASRGCPSHCTFCQRFMGKKFRVRSADNIVSELCYWNKKFKIKEFNFLDDNFTLNKKRVIEVCDLIQQRDLRITFRFPNGVREDFLDEELLDALKSAGCYHLDFGIESGSQKVLDIMKKGKKIEEIAAKVCLCHKKGFKVSASFIFGTPGETLEDMEETIKFAKMLPLDSVGCGIVTPFPGTEIREEAIKKGYLKHSDYEYYNLNLNNVRPAIETPEWTAQDLIQVIKKANRAFFLRPKQILKLLPTMCKTVNIKRYLDSLSKVISNNLLL